MIIINEVNNYLLLKLSCTRHYFLAGVLHALPCFIPNIFISFLKKLKPRKAVLVIPTVHQIAFCPLNTIGL